MRKYISVFIFLVLSANCGLSTDLSDSGAEKIKVLNLKANLKFLASDELEGRETGKRGLKIAAKFLETQYCMAGLTPVPGNSSMYQKFSISKNRILNSSQILLTGHPERQFKNYENFLILSKLADNIHKDFSIIFLGYGQLESDYQNSSIKGKMALVIDATPEIQNLYGNEAVGIFNYKLRRARTEKAELAKKYGAAGIIYVNDLPNYLQFSNKRRRVEKTRSTLSDEKPLLEMVISSSLVNALLKGTNTTIRGLKTSLLSSETPNTKLELSEKIQLKITVSSKVEFSQNIVAYLEGSDEKLKNEIVAFGAHYDHIGINAAGEIHNGADDDGSGTVALLEIARVFAQNSQRPKRSLIFIAHAGEESGLLGSKHFTNHPPVPLENMVANFNIDMIGRNANNSVFIIGSNFLSRDLHKINESANKIVKLDLNYGYNSLDDPNRFYYRSDHYNYAKHNIPIIFYFSGTHEDYHKPTDTIEKIDFDKIQKIAKLVYLTGWNVANADVRPALNGLLLEN